MLKTLRLEEDAPWKQRFRLPLTVWSQVASANPDHGLICSNRSGIYQLYAWQVKTGELKLLTNQPVGVVFGKISADGQYIYFLQDNQGNEIGHFVRVPFTGGAIEDVTPDLPLYSSWSINESHDGQKLGFMTAGKEGFQAYVMQPQPKVLFQSPALSFGPIFSSGGEVLVVATTERTGKNEFSLVAVDTTTGERIGELFDVDASIQFTDFSPVKGDLRLLATTDKSGFSRPLIWNLHSGSRRDIPLPELTGEISAWGWSPDGKRLLLCQIDQAQTQLYLYDIESSALTRLNHPTGHLGDWGGGYFTDEGEIFTAWQSAVNSPSIIALDGHTGELLRTVFSSGEAPAGRPWKSVTFPSSGGANIQAWLAVPEGKGPFPTIIDIHGGPTSAQVEVYSASCQAWLDHGFAWLSVNYRGSTTFGKDFERSIWGNLGSVEVDDLVAARQWLVDQGIAVPDSVLLTGWSYGGYLTLQTAGKTPELWAGGMAGIAIADWALMYEDQAETLRSYQRALFGGSPTEKPEAHAASSPITYADQLRAPILVIQGSNDTRCPARQMRAYEDKLKTLGKSIEMHWFDAGHGARAVEQNIEHQALMLNFAYRILG